MSSDCKIPTEYSVTWLLFSVWYSNTLDWHPDFYKNSENSVQILRDGAGISLFSSVSDVLPEYVDMQFVDTFVQVKTL